MNVFDSAFYLHLLKARLARQEAPSQRKLRVEANHRVAIGALKGDVQLSSRATGWRNMPHRRLWHPSLPMGQGISRTHQDI